MKSKLKRPTLVKLVYIFIFLLVAVVISLLQYRSAHHELLNRFDFAASQLDSVLNEIENQAIFIGELPAVSEAANQQAYRLRTYLSLGDELESLNNTSKFDEIIFIHWSSRKVYQANYGIFDLSRLDVPDELRRAQSGGFYFEPEKVMYYLPLPTSGRQPRALLQLELSPQTLFASFQNIPVEINVGNSIYSSPSKMHSLDRWVELNPARYLPLTWQQGQAKIRFQLPGELLLQSVLRGLAMTVFIAAIFYIVVQMRTRRAQLLLESNRQALKNLLVESGEDLEMQDLERLREYLHESYMGLIRQTKEQQNLINDLRADRSELRRVAFTGTEKNSPVAPATALWLTTTEDKVDEFRTTLKASVDPDYTEIEEMDESFFLLFYPSQGESSCDKRAYGLYYSLAGEAGFFRAVIIGSEYLAMPEARLLHGLQKTLNSDPMKAFIRFEDDEWLSEVQQEADAQFHLDAYLETLADGEDGDKILEKLLSLKLSDIGSARSLAEEILIRLRQINYSHGDRTYPEFITAVLILDRQQLLPEADPMEMKAKLSQIFLSWDERMRKSARRSEEKSDVLMHVEHALEIMHQRYSEPELNIGEIAEILALNPIYFGRIFKDVTRQTPLEYLTGLRLQAAKKLLIEGEASMVMIAEQAGFSDQRSFARFFKKEMGVPPSQWKSSGQ